MTPRPLLVFFIIAVFNTSLSAQILNVEKSRLDSLGQEKKYQIALESSFQIYNRSANAEEQAEFLNISNDLNAIYEPGKHAYILLANLQLTSNNDVEILNNSYVHFRTNFNNRKKFSTEIYLQAQDDKFRGLRNRYLVGGSIRWRAIENEKFEFLLGTGPMFEHERWNNVSNEESEVLNLPKLSSYIISRWEITKTIDVNTIIYYQVGYDPDANLSRQRVSSSTNLNFKITTNFHFTAKFAMSYENNPIFPITKFIYSLENGLRVSF